MAAADSRWEIAVRHVLAVRRGERRAGPGLPPTGAVRAAAAVTGSGRRADPSRGLERRVLLCLAAEALTHNGINPIADCRCGLARACGFRDGRCGRHYLLR